MPQRDEPLRPRDYTALKLIAALGLAEVGLLYLLIAVETPLSPVVRRLTRNPAGVFSLVMSVVTLLFFGVAVILSIREKYAARKARERAG